MGYSLEIVAIVFIPVSIVLVPIIYQSLGPAMWNIFFKVEHQPLYVTFSVRLSIRFAPYLSNCIAYDHDFWHTCVKWWYLHALFLFFSKFCFFLGFWWGKRAKNSPKWQRKSVCHTSYLRNHTSYDCHLWYTCVKWWYLQACFHFFKILIFWV